MGKLTYYAMVSADGYIEDAGGSIEFSDPPADVHRYFNQLASVSSHSLMGRKMYEMMVPFWPDLLENPSGDEVYDEFARNWVPLPKTVFSRTLDEVTANATLAREIDAEEILRLKGSSDGNVDVGGAELASELAGLGLVDEVGMLVKPVILGGGKPFFGPGFAGLPLKHLETIDFSEGNVLIRYEVGPRA